MNTLDLDEHKEHDRENARRILAKDFGLMTTVDSRREYRKYILKGLLDRIYIWFSLLYTATIYYIYIYNYYLPYIIGYSF